MMHSLYRNTTDVEQKDQDTTSGSSCKLRQKFDRWVTDPDNAEYIIIWCRIFLVIGMCAGFFALVMYFFASSSIGVGIFVVMIVFVMGVCPMIWFLLLVLRVRDPESCHEEYK
ncbi:hypothetical protein B0H14DRAFT_2579033 [Mycena olivaceomarginata]|nr:hypothetical protein B0H14DRAFT_2579033 [Mycena olivaceomarginata]